MPIIDEKLTATRVDVKALAAVEIRHSSTAQSSRVYNGVTKKQRQKRIESAKIKLCNLLSTQICMLSKLRYA